MAKLGKSQLFELRTKYGTLNATVLSVPVCGHYVVTVSFKAFQRCFNYTNVNVKLLYHELKKLKIREYIHQNLRLVSTALNTPVRDQSVYKTTINNLANTADRYPAFKMKKSIH